MLDEETSDAPEELHPGVAEEPFERTPNMTPEELTLFGDYLHDKWGLNPVRKTTSRVLNDRGLTEIRAVGEKPMQVDEPDNVPGAPEDPQPVAGQPFDVEDVMSHVRSPEPPSGATGPNVTDSYRLGYIDGVGACLRATRAGRGVHQVEEWLRELGTGIWNGTEPPRKL